MASERDKHLQAAQKWVEQNRLDLAVAEYRKIAQLDPRDARALLKMGDLQTRMADFAGAVATYDGVATLYGQQGFALKAIAVYKQVRELIRKHAPELAAQYGHIGPRLAELYTQLGLTSDALAAWDEVAAGLQRAGRDGDAVQVFERMVELDATNPLPHLRLAEAHCRVQAVDQAIESFWVAARLLLDLERRDDARKVIERILHFRPDPTYARAAAQLYLERATKEDGLQALARLQIAFQADPKDLQTLSLLAQAFSLIDQQEKAVEVFKEMARICRDQDRADLLAEILEHLDQLVPGDREVAGLRAPRRSTAPPPESVMEAEVLSVQEDPPSDPVGVREQGGPPNSFSAERHIVKALADADELVRLGNIGRALETLRIAVEVDPRVIPLHERLRDLLARSGDRQGWIDESMAVAALHVEEGRPEFAEAVVYEVLEAAPEHPGALDLLDSLGLGPVLQPAAEVEPPLPSFDLEGVGADDALASPGRADLDVDDPFGIGGIDSQPLPSFPLGLEADSLTDLDASAPPPKVLSTRLVEDDGAPSEEPIPLVAENAYDDETSFASVAGDATEATEADPFDLDEPVFDGGPVSMAPAALGVALDLPSFDDDEFSTEIGSPAAESAREEPATHDDDDDPAAFEAAPVSMEAPPPSLVGTGEVEEILDEAEFFAMRGLYDDARAILSDALARSPQNPLLLERLQELDELAGAGSSSGTIERPQAAAGEPEPGDRSFDIAASLDALDDLDDARPAPAPAFAHASQEVDVDHVFAKFKEGVRAQVADSDSATHYDLGVAYKEMGLLLDAITEFELAATDPARECNCFAMIAMIQLERGELDASVAACIRGLGAQKKTLDQEMSLYYDLGVVHEMKDARDEALYYFRKIARKDPGYRDVRERIAALDPASAQPARAKASGTDEFEGIFDDLFEKG